MRAIFLRSCCAKGKQLTGSERNGGGGFPFAKYGESHIQLNPRDLLVFYTDGVTEPENAYGEMFGEDRMIELLVRNADCDEAQIVASITDAVREWTASDELQDDMTLLLVRQL